MKDRQLLKDPPEERSGQWFLILVFLLLCALPRLQAGAENLVNDETVIETPTVPTEVDIQTKDVEK